MSGNPFADYVKNEPGEPDAKTEETAKPTSAPVITSTAKPAPSTWGGIKRGEWVWAAKCPDCDNAYVFACITVADEIVWKTWPGKSIGGANTLYACLDCGCAKHPLAPRPMREVWFVHSWFLPFNDVDLGREWRHGDATTWVKFYGTAKTIKVQR